MRSNRLLAFCSAIALACVCMIYQTDTSQACDHCDQNTQAIFDQPCECQTCHCAAINKYSTNLRQKTTSVATYSRNSLKQIPASDSNNIEQYAAPDVDREVDNSSNRNYFDFTKTEVNIVKSTSKQSKYDLCRHRSRQRTHTVSHTKTVTKCPGGICRPNAH